MAVIAFEVELRTFCDIMHLKHILNKMDRIKSQNEMSHV